MKRVLFAFVVLWIAGCAVICTLFANRQPLKPDTAAVNDAVMSGADINDLLEQEYEKINAENHRREVRLQVFLYAYTGLLAITGFWLYFYCEKSVLTPFRKLRKFARDIAAGNLDIPLEMDRHGRFGAFTESFDLMREELKTARENERAADRSKKELVAQLSHDIKTPVASIKAAVELMQISASGEKTKTQLEQIDAKAEQINTLITNMFHATLEELQALSVTVAEIHSTVVSDLLKSADYKGKATSFTVPDCIVLTDAVRLQQVFDNIIGNAYKYANTPLDIRAGFEGQYLVIGIRDFGAGVPADELPLITNKFYRGKNAAVQSGYGLGLYISKVLIAEMSGELHCENRADGFTVKILLKLP